MDAQRMLFQRAMTRTAGVLLLMVCAVSYAEGEIQNAPEPPKIGVLPNGAFEEMKDKGPAAWKAVTFSGGGRFGYPGTGHDGKHCVELTSESGGDLAWEVRIELLPFAQYRLKGWVRTEGVTADNNGGAGLVLQGGATVASRRLTGTQDWTELEATLETNESDCATIRCSLGGGKATGSAWFDGLQLECVSQTTPKPTIAIDASKESAPISKYIYGQFIEHLGRCIQGGIWAEMLEDRKFFNEVGAPLPNGERTAWEKYLGKQPDDAQKLVFGGTVTMDKEHAYVGEHAPCVRLEGTPRPVGIVQDGLGLQKDKTYKGYVILAGDASAAPIEVALMWGARNEGIQTLKLDSITNDYKRYEFTFTPGVDTRSARFRVAAYGSGSFRIGAVSMMPTDNVDGMRADTLALLKELNAPVYRWPGGNFVSGYDWHDGIGDRDKRPPRKNPAWKGAEQNDFGMHEFITFCRHVGAEPYIAVNSGLGGAEAAAEEVAYANAPADTPQGTRRAADGSPEPFGVKWWSVGNEMYGDWQLGHVPLEEYVKRHNAFAEAMRAADPSIKLIGVGATGPWSETMLAQCGGHMELLSEHFYCQDLVGPYAHSRQTVNQIRNKVAEHRRYLETIPALAGKTIPIAMDEWNYWYGPDVYGELGVQYHLKDALGIAAGLHEYFRSSGLVFMANYAQTVNVIGAIKTTKTAAAFDTTGLVLKLYRARFGTVPVALTTDAKPLDVSAAWTEDRSALTLAVVNATRQSCDVPFSIQGATLVSPGRMWTITGSDPMACNEPGKEPQVRIGKTGDAATGPILSIPPLTARIYEWKAKR